MRVASDFRTDSWWAVGTRPARADGAEWTEVTEQSWTKKVVEPPGDPVDAGTGQAVIPLPFWV